MFALFRGALNSIMDLIVDDALRSTAPCYNSERQLLIVTRVCVCVFVLQHLLRWTCKCAANMVNLEALNIRRKFEMKGGINHNEKISRWIVRRKQKIMRARKKIFHHFSSVWLKCLSDAASLGMWVNFFYLLSISRWYVHDILLLSIKRAKEMERGYKMKRTSKKWSPDAISYL